jgi:preprotein translocase subunit SecE
MKAMLHRRLACDRFAEQSVLVSLCGVRATERLNSGGQTRISPCDPNAGIPMSTTNPLQFLQQVRAEVAKVVWPTRREVLLTTLMVFILSALAATFFSLVDLGIRTALTAIIGA